MHLHTFYTEGLAINSYLIADKDSKQALIVDPTRDIEPYLKYVRDEKFIITDIIETHVHADFVSGSHQLKQACMGYPKIHASAMGGQEWTPAYVDRKVQDGDSIDLNGLRCVAMHTPGHTYEHIIWLCYDKTRSIDVPCMAFTGDFIFVGSVGRPDLLGRSDTEKLSKMLYDSLFSRIASLPDYLEIYPGHGAGSLCGKALSARATSTLGYERLFNPFLQEKPYEEWLSYLSKDMSFAPPNFMRIKKINVQGLSPCNLDKSCPIVYLDIRSPDKFEKSHIKDAINIPLGASFCSWASSILFEDTSLVITGDSVEDLEQATKNLKLIGFERILHSIIWNNEEIQKDFIISSEEVVEPKKLFSKIQSESVEPFIIDVRTKSEWNSGHIKQAHHFELSGISYFLPEIPQNHTLFVVCGSGYRAAIATSYLKKKGYPSVYNVAGGMNAWKRAGFPIDEKN